MQFQSGVKTVFIEPLIEPCRISFSSVKWLNLYLKKEAASLTLVVGRFGFRVHLPGWGVAVNVNQ